MLHPVKPLVIAHPKAAAAAPFQRFLEQASFEVRISQWPRHAYELAREVEVGRPVLAAGGDGTLHEVINGLLADGRPQPRVGLLPIGTGNDVARSLKIPFQEGGWLEMVRRDSWRPLDVGQLYAAAREPVHFLSSATAGFSADVSVTARHMRGRVPRKLLFLAATLVQLVRHVRAARVSGSCRIGERDLAIDRCFNVNLANLHLYGGGMVCAPRAVGHDGALDVVVMDLSLAQVIRAFPETYRGRFDAVEGVTQAPFQDFRLTTSRPLPVQADGEYWGVTPVGCRIIPRAISFLQL